jgi:hypothetical protein
MTLPPPEILNSLVARFFRADDITLGGEGHPFLVRYRGQLLDDDSAAAYDRLAEALAPYDVLPLFRREKDGRQAIILIPALPQGKPARLWVNALMFGLTVVSVLFAGAQPEGPLPSDMGGQLLAWVKAIPSGWPFAVSLLSILLAHEFSHYLMTRVHKTRATLPFFIPFLPPLGTMGAFISMQEPPRNKRALFDIGVAGPLGGMLVAIPVLLLGLRLSSLDTVQAVQGTMLEGNSLLYLLAKYITFGRLLPAPVDMHGLSPLLYWLAYFFSGNPAPIGGTDVFIHPVAFAGWAGILVTSLNLIPLGTLDGGHVLYSVFGERARKVFPFFVGALALLGFFWSGWWLWVVLLLWLGQRYAEPLDTITPLDRPRKLVAFFVLILFLLVFTPVPMVLLG